MIIEKSHFEYLVIQRGEVSDARHDFKTWQKAYENSLREIFTSIHPALPESCTSILDIGSGLGGIDILLSRYYGGADICLLDGLDCPPYVFSHHLPFSNAAVALDFHKKNGCERTVCSFPAPPPGRKFDLIVSFAAYAFHILPGDYLSAVKAAMHENTVLIFDVRRTRRDWLKQLVVEFGTPTVLKQGEKFVRVGFKCKQSSSLAVGQR